MHKSQKLKIHEYLRETGPTIRVHGEKSHRNLKSEIPPQYDTKTVYMATGKNEEILGLGIADSEKCLQELTPRTKHSKPNFGLESPTLPSNQNQMIKIIGDIQPKRGEFNTKESSVKTEGRNVNDHVE